MFANHFCISDQLLYPAIELYDWNVLVIIIVGYKIKFIDQSLLSNVSFIYDRVVNTICKLIESFICMYIGWFCLTNKGGTFEYTFILPLLILEKVSSNAF